MIPRRDLPRLPLEVHLAELRKRLIFCLSFLFLVWCLLFYFFPQLTRLFLWPYQQAMGSQELKLVFTSLPEAIMAALKASFFLALTLTLPVFLHQAWAYVSPSLYPDERRWAGRVILLSVFLMFLGVALGYFLFLPAILHFLLSFGYAHFEANLKVQNYLAFVGKTLLISALVAQGPLLVAVLVRLGWLSRKQLKRRRWYLLGGLYLVALFLVPGDFLSQLLLLMAFYLLIELGFVLAKIF